MIDRDLSKLVGHRKKENTKAADQAKELASLKRDVAATFATESGRRTLRWLKDICGYQKSSVVMDPQTFQIQQASTEYNEARRTLYLTIRKLVSRETLISVEINDDSSNELA